MYDLICYQLFAIENSPSMFGKLFRALPTPKSPGYAANFHRQCKYSPESLFLPLMTRIMSCCALVLASLMCIAPIYGQHIQEPHRHYTLREGLPQMQVLCLFQGSRGYIWVGTKYGVGKFNGGTFQNFDNNDGLPGLHINHITEDKLGNIWIATTDGCAYYDGVQWRRIQGLQGVMILDTLGGQIVAWDEVEKSLWQLQPDTAILLRRLDVLKPEAGGHAIRYFPKSLSNDTVATLGFDSKAHMVAVDSFIRPERVNVVGREFAGGLTQTSYNPASRVCYFYRAGVKAPVDSVRVSIRKKRLHHVNLLSLNNGDIFFSVGPELYFRKKGAFDAKRIALSSQYIACLLADREGAIWAGTEGGLYQYFPSGFKYISEENIPNVWGMVQDNEGRYWFGTIEHGLKRMNAGKLEDVFVPDSIFPNDNETYRYYFGAAKDRQGSLYFSHEIGWVRYHKGRFTNLLRHAPRERRFAMLTYFDPERNKVLAGVRGGVYIFDPDTERLDSIIFEGSNKYVRGIAQDGNGNYWFSNTWTGVSKYNIASGKITYFDQKKQQLPFSVSRCITYDTHGGGLWFGAEEGLFHCDELTMRCKRVAVQSVRGDIYSLQVVDSLLMVGNRDGLFVLNLAAYHRVGSDRMKVYHHYNGFVGNEPNQNTAMLDKEGNYWVACIDQVAFIHKSNISFEDHPAKVRIFKLNDKLVPFSNSEEITLPVGENNVKVYFEAIGFQRPLETEYRWRMVGVNNSFGNWSKDAFVLLTRLSNGVHIFEVQSRHPGAGDEQASVSDRVRIRVNLKWHQSPVFYVVFAILLGAFVIRFIQSRREIHKIRTQEKETKQLAAERGRLVKLHQIRALQTQLKPHFLFNLLGSIEYHVKCGDRDKAAANLSQLTGLMRGVLEINPIIEPEELASGKYDISIAREVELLRYYIQLMQTLHDNFDFTIEIEEGLRAEHVFIPALIIQPFVENAIRHGLLPLKGNRPGHLWLRFYYDGATIVCEVRDNGVGMRTKPDSDDTKTERDRIHGIEMVQDRVQLLRDFGRDVSVYFSDNPEGGTVVTIRFGKYL